MFRSEHKIAIRTGLKALPNIAFKKYMVIRVSTDCLVSLGNEKVTVAPLN